MTRKELYKIKQEKYKDKYQLVKWNEYNYRILKDIMYVTRAGRGDNSTYNDCIIMADTETSKKTSEGVHENHVCAFTVSIRAYHENIVTLWGHKPSELIRCLKKIMLHLTGDKTIIYWHNMAYDYVFIRRFLFNEFDNPSKMLATKPHYPIYIEFDNGLIMKDSLILSQRKLEKWASDLEVEHQKSVGKWDYDKIRSQYEEFTGDELEYIEHDTLAGVECLDKTMEQLNKRIYSMPYTATGIPREESRKRGKENYARQLFLKLAPEEALLQSQFENCYHGGFTHANRHYIDQTIERVSAFDFTSSYPFVCWRSSTPCQSGKSSVLVRLQRFLKKMKRMLLSLNLSH